MEPIAAILSVLAAGTAIVDRGISIGQKIKDAIWKRVPREKPKQVLGFITDLGLQSPESVRAAVESWPAPAGFTAAEREELIGLLTNLVRGARFHSTNGTTLSNVVRCEQLIDQLLENIEPKLTAGATFGDWELQQFLGMGSFGEVWMAANRRFPRRRAFKFFTLAGSTQWLEREADALYAVVTHLGECKNVIRYENICQSGTGFPWIEMEYIDGGSLEDWILGSEAGRRTLDPDAVLRGVANGVAAAHRHNIFHRDLKPANILLTADAEPVPKVADFGLSQVDDKPDGRSSYASGAILVGTRMYHPPEASEPYRRRDPAQDDVFSLGVIWYQLLVGRLERPPYDFAMQLDEVGAGPHTIRMISKCLARPDRRYPSACELLDDLESRQDRVSWPVPDGCYDVSAVAEKYLEVMFD